MSEIHKIVAVERERAGKGAARATRRAGRVPAVIYGNKQTPVMIAIDDKIVKREIGKPGFFTRLFEIEVEGKKHRVLARDINFDPVTDWPQHIDFLRVSKTTRIDVAVPVHFVNEEKSEGLKKGGVLNIVRHEVELNCRADEIPEHLDIDLSGFDLGDSIHISAVKLPADAEPTITDRDFTIATIAAPSGLKSEAAAEGEEAEEAEE